MKGSEGGSKDRDSWGRYSRGSERRGILGGVGNRRIRRGSREGKVWEGEI